MFLVLHATYFIGYADPRIGENLFIGFSANQIKLKADKCLLLLNRKKHIYARLELFTSKILYSKKDT